MISTKKLSGIRNTTMSKKCKIPPHQYFYPLKSVYDDHTFLLSSAATQSASSGGVVKTVTGHFSSAGNGVANQSYQQLLQQQQSRQQQQPQQQQQQSKRNHRADLEAHLGGPVPYKIATMGSARRLVNLTLSCQYL